MHMNISPVIPHYDSKCANTFMAVLFWKYNVENILWILNNTAAQM